MWLTGWCDIGYNFLIGEDGNAYEGRGWWTLGAHVSSWNTVSIGICQMGTYTNRVPNSAAISAMENLVTCSVDVVSTLPISLFYVAFVLALRSGVDVAMVIALLGKCKLGLLSPRSPRWRHHGVPRTSPLWLPQCHLPSVLWPHICWRLIVVKLIDWCLNYSLLTRNNDRKQLVSYSLTIKTFYLM